MTNGDNGVQPNNSGHQSSFFKRSSKDTPTPAPVAKTTSFNSAEAVDITIQFIEAKNLPRTDPIGGGSDPYFKATLDGRISYK